jgi:hypothetical protein
MKIKITLGDREIIPEGDGVAFSIFCDGDTVTVSASSSVLLEDGDTKVYTWIPGELLSEGQIVVVECARNAESTTPVEVKIESAVAKAAAEKAYAESILKSRELTKPPGNAH